MTDSEGLIFDVKRYAINDGPGIRVTFFLKGCNLSCAWCHNPEGISPCIEKMFTASKCIGCGTCVAACPSDALTLSGNVVTTNRDRCTLCGICADVCPSRAFEMSGKRYSVKDIVDIVVKEKVFIEESKGGVTFSGGEPLLQAEFLFSALKSLGEMGIHRAVDTAGHVNPELLRKAAALTDLFLFDLKMMDPKRHLQWTGVSNELIHDNLRMLSGMKADIIVRIPLIGGINDDEENLAETIHLLTSLPGKIREVHLLPYHAIALHKYAKLERDQEFERFEEPDAETINTFIEVFRAQGIHAQSGG